MHRAARRWGGIHAGDMPHSRQRPPRPQTQAVPAADMIPGWRQVGQRQDAGSAARPGPEPSPHLAPDAQGSKQNRSLAQSGRGRPSAPAAGASGASMDAHAPHWGANPTPTPGMAPIAGAKRGQKAGRIFALCSRMHASPPRWRRAYGRLGNCVVILRRLFMAISWVSLRSAAGAGGCGFFLPAGLTVDFWMA